MAPNRADLMKQLLKLDGYVSGEYDPYAYGIQPPSPTLAYCFDNTWLLPFGYTLLLWGEQKGGKSLIARMMCGALHRADPEAVILYYNTEMREELQATPAQLRLWGIDRERYVPYNVNEPENIFDPIEQQVPKLIEQGLPIKLVVIDSVSDILGRKMMNATSVNQQLMGDKAQTQQDGLARIKGVIRRNRIGLILTTQARVKHFAEYFCFVEHLRTKEGKTDLTGNTFEDTSREGVVSDNLEIRARKIRVTMEGNSCGRAGRQGVFTLDNDRGLINTHEEVGLLGCGLKVIAQPSKGRFEFNDRKWHGFKDLLSDLAAETTLYDNVLRQCKLVDLARKDGVPAPEQTPAEVSA
jgi:hypothetical protein